MILFLDLEVGGCVEIEASSYQCQRTIWVKGMMKQYLGEIRPKPISLVSAAAVSNMGEVQ